MSNKRSSAAKAFSDDENTGLNRDALGLRALSNMSPLFKLALFFAVAALTFTVLWWLWLGASLTELTRVQAEEIKLQEALAARQLKIAQLAPLKKQQEQILLGIASAELALSQKGEMAGLLKDINRAGLSRGLQFEIFRPEKEVPHAHYAELPISLRVTGRYDNLGFFAADIAGLPRLVTLDHLVMTPLKEGHLMLEASLHAYRHLNDAAPSPVKASPAGPARSLFQAQRYQPASALDPFNTQRLALAHKKEWQLSAAQSDLLGVQWRRKKEKLEEFPLDAMAMVGRMTTDGQQVALVKVEAFLYSVRLGSHLGQNFGRVVSINDLGLRLRELVQDPAGKWTERMTTLALQERLK